MHREAKRQSARSEVITGNSPSADSFRSSRHAGKPKAGPSKCHANGTVWAGTAVFPNRRDACFPGASAGGQGTVGGEFGFGFSLGSFDGDDGELGWGETGGGVAEGGGADAFDGQRFCLVPGFFG